MLALDTGHSFVAPELQTLQRRFKNWREFTRRLGPAGDSVLVSQEIQQTAAEDLAFMSRIERIVRQHVPHMIPPSR